MHYNLEIKDEFKMQDKLGGGSVEAKPPVMHEYIVTAKTGIFKNGRHYKKGDSVMLVAKAADVFLREKEIRRVDGESFERYD